MNNKYTKKKYKEGFSLVEFIVVLVIFSIMSGVSLFNYSGYSSSIKETNITQDIALAIRQAQVYGVSAAGRNIGGAGFSDSDILNIPDITQDRSVRGVAVITESNEFIIFEDLNTSRDYETNTNPPDTIIDVRKITDNGFNISVCLIGFGSSSTIDSTLSDCDELVGGDDTPVSVTFQRPYPDAYVEYDGSPYSYAFVILHSGSQPSVGDKYIEVSPLGRISVKTL